MEIKNIIGYIKKVEMVARSADDQKAFPVKGTGVIVFFRLRKTEGTEHFAGLQQKEASVRSDPGHFSGFISRKTVGIIHLGQGADLFQTAAERQHLQAARGADIIVPIGTLDDRADRIGRKAMLLVQYIYNFLMDRNGKPAVVGADPQSPFRVDIQAVDVAHRIHGVHPLKIPAVIAVKPGIGGDPEDPVIGLDDIICLPAGKTVFTAVYRTNISPEVILICRD